jgi:formylmethanofuran dehydrogenase subunit E
MPEYKPTCPKCKHSIWLDEYYHQQFQVGCSMCGFRLVGEKAIRLFINNQKTVWDQQQVEKLKAAEEAAKEEARKQREIKRETKKVAKARIIKKAPLTPTSAQQRRGATTPTVCAHCGEYLFRRKKDVAAGHSFCTADHQRVWKKTRKAA